MSKAENTENRDEDRFDERLYMSSQEAARELGVSIATLYSYVSRRNIRTKQIEGTRKRLYWRADIARAKRGAEGVETSFGLGHESDITLLTTEGPFYRGMSAIKLAETYTLEQVAGLLWRSEEAEVFGGKPSAGSPEIAQLLNVLCDMPTTDKAIALLPLLEKANARAFDLSETGMARSGADVLRWYTAILTGRDTSSSEPLHEQIASSIGATSGASDLIRRLLVLSADHGFGAGTFAVRAVASTGVSPYRSVLAGLAITAGRRSRLGRTEAIWRFVSELTASADPKTAVLQRLRDGEAVPGFDSPQIYGGFDPRADAFLKSMERQFGDHPDYRKLCLAADVMVEVAEKGPGLALTNMLLMKMIGLPHNKVLYLLGRCAGWIAHSIEQYQHGEIVSPNTIHRTIGAP